MTGDSKAKMISSAAALIASRGVSATSFSDVVQDSGAPRGSIYHHFPNGKRQLAEECIRWTSDRVVAYQQAGGEMSADEVVRRFVGMWRGVVLGSAGASGCVVAGVALDTVAGADPTLIALVRDIYRSWTGLLTEQLVSAGLSPTRAHTVAVTVLAAMEGALILCRAEGSAAVLESAADLLLELVS